MLGRERKPAKCILCVQILNIVEMKMRPVLFLVLGLMMAGASHAEQSQRDRLYLGGGVSFNTLGSGNATGLEIFAGYGLNLLINDDIRMAVEIGYLDTGDFDFFGSGRSESADGVWVAAPFNIAINNKVDMLLRVGVDFGDDDGAIVGTGMGYNFNRQTALRVEYQVRDNVNGLHFNMLFRL